MGDRWTRGQLERGGEESTTREVTVANSALSPDP